MFYSYNEYLKNKYKEKTYKLSVQIPTTCPNRDPITGKGGCHFCSEKGTGFESMHSMTPVKDQLAEAKKRVSQRYKAKKFIAYFQNYTTTYINLEDFINFMKEVVDEDIVGIDISSRPDTLADTYLKALKQFSETYKIDVHFEIGLQLADDELLEEMNRQHTVADYVDCVNRLHQYGFTCTTQLILNIPNSTREQVLKTALLMNKVSSDVVKLHSLYIAKDSEYGRLYAANQLDVGSCDEYIERVLLFITHLKPDIAIGRLVSRIPEEDALFSNWNMSWWKIYNQIQYQLVNRKLTQGCLYKREL